MSIFFTADQHFDHANIIKYCSRPFDDVNEMNETMLERHNKMVTNRDIVYHLGDFAFSPRVKFWLDRLNGKEHHLILGNHDHKKMKKLKENFTSVQAVKLINIGESSIFMSHYAHLVWPNRHYGTYHLFGHSHGTVQGLVGSLDVGVDSHGFYPSPWEDIKEVIDNRKAVSKGD